VRLGSPDGGRTGGVDVDVAGEFGSKRVVAVAKTGDRVPP
jgi:hypothetical protein